METARCLYCYLPLNVGEVDFHPGCSRKMFGSFEPPILPYSEDQMEELAYQVIRSQMTVTGVQPKLSLEIAKGNPKDNPKRFTIVGLWGEYILKPPSPLYPQMPEDEDLTMHLARLAKIQTVPHSLIRMQSGSLAYITKRIDRTKNSKLHMEDMCQLSERLTEDKYHGSYEQIAKTIMKYSANPVLDVINFFEQLLFSFLTGNADMHLKNFSLINRPGIGYSLAPAYDMLSTVLLNTEDKEELVLTLNGKKRKIQKADFIAAMNTLHLDQKVQKNLFKKFETAIPVWQNFIKNSFLDAENKVKYSSIITDNELLTA